MRPTRPLSITTSSASAEPPLIFMRGRSSSNRWLRFPMHPVESELEPYVARLAAGMCRLPDKPDETPQATARALWHLAAGARLSLHSAQKKPLPPLDAQGVKRLAALVEQRMQGVPLAHLTGMQRFMGL